ncbi:hypothetical protein [Burkholderia cepacia]|uniref:hypothetical protein n=1 Tax=Burkholderia cepacia TaxID=292 RepID=UPI002AB65923|nr:hypothetical protein [Burkholderia cepacia]
MTSIEKCDTHAPRMDDWITWKRFPAAQVLSQQVGEIAQVPGVCPRIGGCATLLRAANRDREKTVLNTQRDFSDAA